MEFHHSYEILVVDDHSTDHSVKLVNDYIVDNPHLEIQLFENKNVCGLGNNFVKAAINGRGEYFKLVHAGNLERPVDIGQFIRSLGEADVITCYINDKRSISRRLLSKGYTLLIGFTSGYSLKYYQGAALIPRIDIVRYHPNNSGSAFLSELLIILLNIGRSVKEIEIEQENATRKSKAISWRNAVSVVQTIVNIVLRRISG